MKKAQGISINVIIIAAIALLILVILSVLVLRSGGKLTAGTGCQAVDGICVSSFDTCPDGLTTDITRGCPTEDQPKCCIPAP